MTGGAGQFRTDKPGNATNGFMRAWGGNAATHFLIVTIDTSTMSIKPITEDGTALPLVDRQGSKVEAPIAVNV